MTGTRPPFEFDPAAMPMAYDAVESHDDLVAWSRAYARHVVTSGVDVSLDLVDWRVSTRAKRRAAAVRRPRIPDTAVGTPIDWADAVERFGDGYAADRDREPADLRRCTVVLTWGAYESFDRVEWAETLRHELVHVEQFQSFGTTDHGRLFERRARDLSASLHCRHFSTPRYLVTCTDCEAVVARRFRDCKLVRQPERHRSRCCGAPVESSRNPEFEG